MNNVSESTQVSPKQTLKDVESYLAFTALTDYRSNNPAHSREVADLAYKTLRDAELTAITSQAAADAAADALAKARRGPLVRSWRNSQSVLRPSRKQLSALSLALDQYRAGESQPLRRFRQDQRRLLELIRHRMGAHVDRSFKKGALFH